MNYLDIKFKFIIFAPHIKNKYHFPRFLQSQLCIPHFLDFFQQQYNYAFRRRIV